MTRSPAKPNPKNARVSILIGVFLVSVATLHLEILQTRVFSVLLWHHVTYLVVTFTLLGFAASGTFLFFFPNLLNRNPRHFLAICSLMFSLATVSAFMYLGKSELDTLQLFSDRTQYLYVFVYYLYLTVPYFLAGLVVLGALKTGFPGTGTVYGVNLVGSALGCVLVLGTLRDLGGEGSVLLAASLSAVGAAAFVGRITMLSVGAVLFAVVSLVSVPHADNVLTFRAAKSKLMMKVLARQDGKHGKAKVLETIWDPLYRIDLVDTGSKHSLMIFQDGDAPAAMLKADRPHDRTSIYNLPYLVLGRNIDALVIGVGGGQDIRYALWNGADRVTGAEINHSTVQLLKSKYSEYAGHLHENPKVNILESEGRSYVHRASNDYDLIQMTGTDTYAALASGSYVLSESYLYTVEAFSDFFDALKNDGAVSVLRLRFFPPREGLRLMVIAVQALRALGVEQPERHILAVDMIQHFPSPGAPGKTVKLAYTSMLFKKTPFSKTEIQVAKNFTNVELPTGVYRLAYAPGMRVVTESGQSNAFTRYMQAVATGTEQSFLSVYPYDVRPVFDDAPFFFNFHRWDQILEARSNARPDRIRGYFRVIGESPLGLFLLVTALLETVILVGLLVIAPLVLSRRVRLPTRHRVPVLFYFLGLGAGFLFLEIAYMQRLVLYLGHPIRSITVVLSTFLLAAGLGAIAAERGFLNKSLPTIISTIVLIIGLYSFVLPYVLDATLGFTTMYRIAIAGVLLALPAFFMGMPFPLAMAGLRGPHAPYLPWAYAINGGASVVASVAAILLAMVWGFTGVSWVALGFYVAAFISQKRLPSIRQAEC